jgi:alpha-2-macroglobulin
MDDPLPARPRVRLEFSRDVKPGDVPQAVFFEDNVSHERFPIEVSVEGVQNDAPQGWLIVEPTKLLPAGRTFLLVVERLKASASGELLPRQRVVPAGTTNPLKIKVVAGYNQPVKGAFIRVRASKPIDPESALAGTIVVEPSVPKLKSDRDARNGRTIELLGDFDIAKVYKVTLRAGLKSVDQFELGQDSVWTARFSRKRPAVIVRGPAFSFQRATASSVLASVLQVNTGPLEWKLALVSPEKLPQLWNELREFGRAVEDEKGNIATDPANGEYLSPPTKLLVPSHQLQVVASGSFEGAEGDREVARKVEWKPGDNKPGIYLLEISGKDSAGRVVGNRSLISRSDWVITGIQAPGNFVVRVAGMSDGKPVADVPVRLLADPDQLTPAVMTDAHGEASFGDVPVSEPKTPFEAIIAGAPGHQCVQLLGEPKFPGADRFSSTRAAPDAAPHPIGFLVLDRNLYRPGEVMKFKGFRRMANGDRLSLPPAGEEVAWEIVSDEKTIHTGTSRLSKNGSWEGEWQIPVSALGQYKITADGSQDFGVAEFRPLPFTITTETEPTHGDTATLKVSSSHFFGGPNARAKIRWTADWLADPPDSEGRDNFVIDDQHSPDSPARGFSLEVLSNIAKAGWDVTHTGLNLEVGAAMSVRGEETLDENGARTIVCKSPFRPGLHPRAHVTWKVEVFSASAQVVTGAATTAIQAVPKILAARLEPADGRVDALALKVKSLDVNNKPANGLPAKAEIYRVTVSTVKEKLAPNLNRYRNSPKFEKVFEKELTTPAEITVPVDKPGRYIAKVTAPSQPNTPQVSDTAMIEGFWSDHAKDVTVPVDSDSGLTLKAERERYTSGETAMISLETPFTGIANVMVATDRILWRESFPITSNNQRIPVPVLPSFAPNAHVCVHLIKAAGADGIPTERYGVCELKVDRADRKLQVTTKLARDVVQPGEEVTGVVQVKLDGKPAANADVLIFAADDAILELGKWKLPDLLREFYPERSLEISTSSALGQYTVPDEAGPLTRSQKGFILGASGLLKGGPVLPFRKFFKALAFWQPDAQTNAAGEVAFRFQAPDSLTRYRVVAIAQREAEQFGAAETRVQLAKSLQIEPALPAFLRIGDEVNLRAVVRQDFAPSDEIDVKVERLGEAMQLIDPETRRITAKKGEPVVVNFRAKVGPGPDHARVLLSATSTSQPERRDAEDNTLPIRSSDIEVHETVPGSVAQGKPLDLRAALPARWQQASSGSCDVFLSGSRYLPKLAGLFPILEAGGSIEKLSARLLTATFLADTMSFLPQTPDAAKKLRTSTEEGIRLLDDSNCASSSFAQPLWPESEDSNDFVTVQAAWAVLNADRLGIMVNPEMKRQAKDALEFMVGGTENYADTPSSVRCFALMVLGHDQAKRRSNASEEESSEPSTELSAEAAALFAKRAELNEEGTAWLALGLHYLRILPKEKAALLAAISHPVKPADFDPVTFGSKKRAEAVCLFAQCEIASTNWSDAKRKSVRDAFEKITQSSIDPSTQENLWLLAVFNSLIGGDIPPQIDPRRLTPQPSSVSKNQVSVAWMGVPFQKFAETFAKPLEPKVQASYLFRASYSPPATALPPRNPGFALERRWRNLTDSRRIGTAEAPLKLGDQILVTYELRTELPHSYLEVEDQLPACFETVNPKLPLVAEYYKLPPEAGVNTLPLANVEERTASTKLYFEKTLPGRNVYSVLERVGTAGTFHWPGTQLRPMYDNRFFGFSDATTIISTE